MSAKPVLQSHQTPQHHWHTSHRLLIRVPSLIVIFQTSCQMRTKTVPQALSPDWPRTRVGLVQGRSSGVPSWAFGVGKVESAQNQPPRKGSVGTLNYGTSPTDVAIETTASYPPNHGDPQSRQADTSSVSLPQTIPPRLQASSDGVIDVDINIPGFFSKSLEAGLRSAVPFIAQRSPSSKSIDGSSMHSSKSYADALTSRESPDPINVAGFLKRYHPDFILQAVKPYPEITAEIKASMSLRTNPGS